MAGWGRGWNPPFIVWSLSCNLFDKSFHHYHFFHTAVLLLPYLTTRPKPEKYCSRSSSLRESLRAPIKILLLPSQALSNVALNSIFVCLYLKKKKYKNILNFIIIRFTMFRECPLCSNSMEVFIKNPKDFHWPYLASIWSEVFSDFLSFQLNVL